MITTLIDKQDNSEIIRDQLAAILAIEVAAQMVLATAAGKDPNDWKLRIFTERANPWEQFRDFTDGVTDDSPLVNVWFGDADFDKSKSDIFEKQKADGTFNFDVYGVSISSDDPLGGHKPGDREAAFEVQRGMRLVRNILMAAHYTRLDLDGIVWDRWPESITMFQPMLEDNIPIQHVMASRLVLNVGFHELSSQIEMETLELLSSDVHRTFDGQIVAEADIAYPLP